MVKGHRPDTPVRPRRPVVLGDNHPTDDPCAAPRTVHFDLEATAAIGASIHLVPIEDQVWITAASSRIGRLSVADAREIADCIADSWAFDGTIAEISQATATAVVRGHRTR